MEAMLEQEQGGRMNRDTVAETCGKPNKQ